MSLCSQIQSELSSSSVSFEHLVIKLEDDSDAKALTSKAKLAAIIFSYLAKTDSTMKLSNGLLSCNGKAKHLGTKTAHKRSTRAYAN